MTMLGTTTSADAMSAPTAGNDLSRSSVEVGLGLPEQCGSADAGLAAVPWIEVISPLEQNLSTYQATECFSSRWETGFTPRTDLGKKLRALRSRAIGEGMKLLSEEEVLSEVKRRRGERQDDETVLY